METVENNSFATFKSLARSSDPANFYLKFGLCACFERSPVRDIYIPGHGKSGLIIIKSIAVSRRIDGSGIMIPAAENEINLEFGKVIVIRSLVFFDCMIFAKTSTGKLFRHKHLKGSLSLHINDEVYADIRAQINNRIQTDQLPESILGNQ